MFFLPTSQTTSSNKTNSILYSVLTNMKFYLTMQEEILVFSLHIETGFGYLVMIIHECKEWVKKPQHSWGTILATVNLPLKFTNISGNVRTKPINKQALVSQFWLFRDEKAGSFVYKADKLNSITLNCSWRYMKSS